MKLKLTYAPEDGPEQNWELDPATILSVEAEMLEEAGGSVWNSYGEFWSYVEAGNIRSWRALLWLMLRRTNPRLGFQSVVFKINEFGVDFDAPSEESPKDEPDEPATDSPSAPPDLPPGSES